MAKWYSPSRVPDSVVIDTSSALNAEPVWADIGWDSSFWGPMPDRVFIVAGAVRNVRR